MDSQTHPIGKKGRPTHETQLCESGEANLFNHFTQCTKNPGHEEFIPVKTFSSRNLPEVYRDHDLYTLVKTLADLTVRIGIEMTSLNRPEIWPGTKEPYAFYEIRGSNTLRTGTGRVFSLTKYKDGSDDCGTMHFQRHTACWCSSCKGSMFPQKEWWEIQILTANHVVFDDIEALNTSVRFFFDSEDSLRKICLDGMIVVSADVHEDRCVMKLVTCNVELGQMLYAIQRSYREALERVYFKLYWRDQRSKLAIIISHPHGCCKHISVGEWQSLHQVGSHNFNNKFYYSTCTCPGSSGAPVLLLDYIGWEPLIHSGTFLESQQNYSAPGPVGREKPAKYCEKGFRNLYI